MADVDLRKSGHDVRPATGYCGRCTKRAVGRCYNHGNNGYREPKCRLAGSKLCQHHLDDHDARHEEYEVHDD